MKSVFLLLLTTAIPLALAAQTTHTVDNDPGAGAQFTSVQNAINAANAGDTIYIQPSTISYGNVTVNKTIHLRGIAHSPEFNAGNYAILGDITFDSPIGAPNSSVSGLRFGRISTNGNQNYSGLSVTNNYIENYVSVGSSQSNCSNWYIAGNVFVTNSSAGAIHKYNTSTSPNWMVVNNHIRQPSTSTNYAAFSRIGVSDIVRNNVLVFQHNGSNSTVCNQCSGAKIENSLILFTGNSTGVNGSGVTFNHSLIHSYVGQTMTDLPGMNNLNADPGFVDAADPTYSVSKDFHIASSSPAYAHGTDGQQLGIHGNNFQFSKWGYPDDLPYIRSFVAPTVVPIGGFLEVQLEAVGN